MKNEKVKILVVGQTPPPFGGQIIHIGKIVNILTTYNYNFKLVRMDFSGDMDEMGKLTIFKILKLFQIQFKILWYLCMYRPDYVYYPPSGCEKKPVYRDIMILSLIKILKFKTIFHFHAGGISDLYNDLNPFIKKIFRFVFFNSEYSICMSNSGLRDPQFLKSKNISIIPYGVEDFKLKKKADKNTDSFQVLFVGVCRESKGILDYLKIVESAHKTDSRIVGKVVGKIFSNKEQVAIDNGVREGFITFEGIKIGAEKKAIYNESDVFLFPTFFEHENFPTVILEAFSASLPVISTNWRGVVDMIYNDKNGFRTDVHDLTKMADYILSINRDKELHRKLSTNARKSYEDYYSDHIFVENIVNFFNSLK